MKNLKKKILNIFLIFMMAITILPSTSMAAEVSKLDSFVNYAVSKNGYRYSQKYRMSDRYFDCSSLVLRSMRAAGLDTTKANLTTRSISNDKRFTKISKNQLQKGDILWQRGHIAIYMGDNKTFEAMNPRQGVGYSKMGNRFSQFYRIKGL